jgi:dienelactone hydrolase
LPQAPGERPGVIVIHEIFGLNDDIRRITGRIADLSAYGPMKVGSNAAAAEDSWRRIAAFFAQHLGQ